LPTHEEAAAMAAQVRETLAACPLDGLSYGLLRHGEDATVAATLAALPAADVLVNYVGVLDGWTEAPFQPVDADTGPTIAADLPRSHRIELNAGVVAGKLRIALNYAAGPDAEAAARDLLSRLEAALSHLARLAEPAGGEHGTPGLTSTAPAPARAGNANEPLLPLTPVQRAILLHSLRASDTYFDQIRFR